MYIAVIDSEIKFEGIASFFAVLRNANRVLFFSGSNHRSTIATEKHARQIFVIRNMGSRDGSPVRGLEQQGVKVHLCSYGSKYTPRPSAKWIVVDCTPLNNPYHNRKLREQTGESKEVYDFVCRGTDFEKIKTDVHALIDAARLSGNILYLAFRCIGGRHRSVAMRRYTAEYCRTHDIPCVDKGLCKV